MPTNEKLENYLSQKIDNREKLTEDELKKLTTTFSYYETLKNIDNDIDSFFSYFKPLKNKNDEYRTISMVTIAKLSNKYYYLSWAYGDDLSETKIFNEQPIEVYPMIKGIKCYFGHCRIWVDSSGKVLLNY